MVEILNNVNLLTQIKQLLVLLPQKNDQSMEVNLEMSKNNSPPFKAALIPDSVG